MAETLAGDAEVSALAEFAAGLGLDQIPPAVRHHAKRALVNILGTTIAGSREPAVEKALTALRPFSGPPTASLIGRGERTDAALAASINAMAANIHDFDDTHPPTIIHPTAPVAPPLLALAETRGCTGAELIRAFVIGVEVECRIGLAMSPSHYTRGWHITATCGVFGAAAASGALLRLDARHITWSLANAAVQAAGLVGTLGTMSKSIGVGNVARGGMIAALLAEQGFSGPASALSGPRGYLQVACDDPDPARLAAGLGQTWELAANTCKPYPAGVVLAPVIDACLKVAARPGFRPEAVAAVELTGHPLLRARTDRPDVSTGRESQVCAQHAIAIALARRRAGLAEFDDAAAAETLAAGRPPVTFHDDPDRDVATVAMTVRMRDGTVHQAEIAAARGSEGNPVTDTDLEQKLSELAVQVGFNGDPGALAQSIWELDEAEDAGAVARLACGGSGASAMANQVKIR